MSNKILHAQALCVSGYIRKNYKNSKYPEELTALCLLFYCVPSDQWHRDWTEEQFEIENNGRTLKGGKGNKFKGRNEWSYACGTCIVRKGELAVWKIRMSNGGAYQGTMFGVVDVNEVRFLKNNEILRNGYYGCSWGYYTLNGRKLSKGRYYDCVDRVITMTLDMTGTDGILSFSVDGKKGMDAHSLMDINGTYVMTLTTRFNNYIELLDVE